MGMLGMNDTERQILMNQAAIMGFLHSMFLNNITQINEASYKSMFACFKMTQGLLDADIELKKSVLGVE